MYAMSMLSAREETTGSRSCSLVITFITGNVMESLESTVQITTGNPWKLKIFYNISITFPTSKISNAQLFTGKLRDNLEIPLGDGTQSANSVGG